MAFRPARGVDYFAVAVDSRTKSLHTVLRGAALRQQLEPAHIIDVILTLNRVPQGSAMFPKRSRR